MTAAILPPADLAAMEERAAGAAWLSADEITSMLVDMESGDGKPSIWHCIALAKQARLAHDIPKLLRSHAALTERVAELEGAAATALNAWHGYGSLVDAMVSLRSLTGEQK